MKIRRETNQVDSGENVCMGISEGTRMRGEFLFHFNFTHQKYLKVTSGSKGRCTQIIKNLTFISGQANKTEPQEQLDTRVELEISNSMKK